jgi:DNA-directed RNA polymerase specialized sigma24 family protein
VHAAGRYKHQVLSRAISLNAPYGGDATASDRGSLTLVDTLAGPDGQADPEARLLAAEQLRSVVRALPTLTPTERRALTASANGEPYEHLASVLGGSAKAVERAAYRARRKFAYAHSEAA